MRLLKVFLTALFALIALVAGLFVAAAVALSGAAFFAARRLRNGQSAARPAPHAPARMKSTGDVIDVTATEVPADRLQP